MSESSSLKSNPYYLLLRSALRVTAALVIVAVVAGFFLPSNYVISRSLSVEHGTFSFHKWHHYSTWSRWMPLPEGAIVIEADEKGAFNVVLKDGEIKQSIQILQSSDQLFSFNVVSKKSESGVIQNRLWVERGEGGERLNWETSGELSVGFLGPYLALVADSLAGANLERGLENILEGRNGD